jgi:TolB-like protein/Flp pilus assembly protein TadD
VLWLYAQRSVPTTTTAAAVKPAPASAASDARPSIAVLPFENRSDESKDAYFVDGIHDDILTQLSKVSAIRVISRTSVERFRDTELPMKAIADQLGVTKILEGGVQRAGDRVRIHMQLIDAGSDAHLWAESYDRELTVTNMFAIQSEVAAAIAAALKATLTAGEQARVNAIPTQSLDAWRDYQLGKQRMASRTSAALADAEKHFRKAITLDPQFALAWVGLADTLTMQTFYAGRLLAAGLDEAEKAAARAMELDPDLAEAWASAGLIAHHRQQLERGETMFRRAIALNSNYAPAHQWLGNILFESGRRDEALASLERAVALDPLSAAINNALGGAREGVGRFDDALAAYKQAIEIDPKMPGPYWSIGYAYAYGLARFDTAMPWFEKAASLDSGDPEGPALVASAHWELGDGAEATRRLAQMPASGEGTVSTNFLAALLYLDRGDEAAARKHAQLAAEMLPAAMYLIRDDDLRKGDYATARARYAKAFPELFAKELPRLTHRAAGAALELALVLQHTGERERAKALLDRSEAYFRTIPRMGGGGYGIADVAIHALRGDRSTALAKLREAEQAGWRALWRYYRDYDPALASIRNDPEFKAIFADIERDMAKQRAALAARPKDAPLDLAAAGT